MSRRDVNPIFQLIRSFLLGRDHTLALRYEEDMSCRTQSPPCIPDGPHHKCSKNYYWTRNARSSVAPPENLVIPEPDKLESIAEPAKDQKDEDKKKSKKKGKECACPQVTKRGGRDKKTKFRGPGKVFGWDQVHD